MRYKSAEDRIVDAVAIIIVTIVAICCLYPMIYCISMSFSDDEAILKNSVVLLPKGFNFDSYKKVLLDKGFLNALKNAVVQTALSTVISVFCNMSFGYLLTRKNFVFKKFLNLYILVPMMFGGGLIPTYLLIKSLGLYNTVWAVVLPGAVSIYNAILARTFIQTNIPDDLLDAAKIDGANDVQIFSRIVLPMSTTIIAILALYAAVGSWNDYYGPMIYLRDEALQPLQLYLKKILGQAGSMSMISDMLDPGQYIKNLVTASRVKYVLIVVSTLPIIVMYPFIQKYFVKGITLGSVKG